MGQGRGEGFMDHREIVLHPKGQVNQPRTHSYQRDYSASTTHKQIQLSSTYGNLLFQGMDKHHTPGGKRGPLTTLSSLH